MRTHGDYLKGTWEEDSMLKTESYGICDNCGAKIRFFEDEGELKYGKDLKQGEVSFSEKGIFTGLEDDIQDTLDYSYTELGRYCNKEKYVYINNETFVMYVLQKAAEKKGYGPNFYQFYYSIPDDSYLSEAYTGYSKKNSSIDLAGDKRGVNFKKGEEIEYSLSFKASCSPNSYNRHVAKLTSELTCPVCGSKDIDESDRWHANDDWINRVIEKNCKEKVRKLISKYEEEFGYAPVSSSNKKVNLLEYISHLIDIETDIMFYSRCLTELLIKQTPFRRQVNYTQYTEEELLKTKLDDECNELENRKERMASENEINEADYDVESFLDKKGMPKPSKPSAPSEPNLVKPIEPLLQKPSIFNKKRIESENAILLSQYNSQVEKYNNTWERYQQMLIRYQEEMTEYENKIAEYQRMSRLCEQELEAEKEAEKEKIKKEREKEIKEIDFQIDEKTKQKNNIAGLVRDQIEESTEYSLFSFYQEEISEIERILTSLFQCRKEFYDMNIIYPKYRSIVPLASIFEYLQSGRCSELEGPTGAYNMYESESRADIIICKLDDIISSLEEIKANQYRLYQEVKSINASISRLNDSLTSGLKDINLSIKETNGILKEHGEKLDEIKENTKMTAYFTEKNAEYSKRNLKYTEALTYIALIK